MKKELIYWIDKIIYVQEDTLPEKNIEPDLFKSQSLEIKELKKVKNWVKSYFTEKITSLRHDQLPIFFKDISYSKLSSDSITETYILHQNGKDVLSIHWLGDNEWRFVKDCFPHQRKFYSTNCPIKSVERFISEMENIGIKVELVNP